MKEILSPRVKGSLREAGQMTGRCVGRYGIPLGAAVGGGASIANRDYIFGASLLGAAVGMSAINSIGEDIKDKIRGEQAFKAGLSVNHHVNQGTIFDILNNISSVEVREIGIPFIERSPEEEPLYKSLDGKQAIYSTPDLVESLGDSPHSIAVRIMTALRHTEKRPATISDIELFRRADTLLGIAPDVEEILCEDGGETIEKMRQVIGSYEAFHEFDHDEK